MTVLSTQEQRALKALEAMSEKEWQSFFSEKLPLRVQILIKGGMVDWREVMPRWYIREQNIEANTQKLDYPF